MSAAAIVVILNPKTRPQSSPIGSNTRTYEVNILENATDAEVLQAVLAQLETDQD